MADSLAAYVICGLAEETLGLPNELQFTSLDIKTI